MVGKLGKKGEAVSFESREGRTWITLRDSRIVSMPLAFFPWLEQATPEQRANYELYPEQIYWPDLDDGIDIYAFVTGDWIKRPNLSQVG